MSYFLKQPNAKKYFEIWPKFAMDCTGNPVKTCHLHVWTGFFLEYDGKPCMGLATVNFVVLESD